MNSTPLNNNNNQNITIPSSQPTQTQESASQQPTYSQKLLLIKKEQAIIINPLPDIPFKEYLIALGTIIDPQTILSASRISHQRICVFLNSKENAEKLLNAHKTLKVQNQITTIRSYVTPTHRLMVWCMPMIPHDAIINQLKRYGAEPTSAMYNLSAGINQPGFNHITSFRRFIFVRDNHPQIPEAIDVTHENEIHKVFITVDDTKCAQCNKYGHESQNCRTIIHTMHTATIIPNEIEQSVSHTPEITLDRQTQLQTQTEITNTIDEPTQPNNTPSTENPDTTQLSFLTPELQPKVIISKEFIVPPHIYEAKKRARPSSSSLDTDDRDDRESNSEPDLSQKKSIEQDHKKNKKNKQSEKSETKNTLLDLIQPLKIHMEKNPSNFILNFNQLKTFIGDTRGNAKMKDIIPKYADDPDHIIHMLETLYEILPDPYSKAGFSKLITKIKNTQKTRSITNSSDQENESN